MTKDTTPAASALKRVITTVAVAFDSHLAANARMELAALSAQLEDAVVTADDMEKEAHSAIALWGAALKDRETARAEGKTEGLREAAKLAWDMDAKYLRTEYEINHNRKRYDIFGVKRCEDKAANVISEDIHNAILALIPADTPAEPAQVTVQEAAKVLLGDDYTSPLIEVLDAYNNDYDVAQDVLKALRAIAGGRDE